MSDVRSYVAQQRRIVHMLHGTKVLIGLVKL